MTSELWKQESAMPKVDMSAKAVTTRLKRVAQLRRLGLSLQNAKIKEDKSVEEKRNPASPKFGQVQK
jgi:hypothetical protein